MAERTTVMSRPMRELERRAIAAEKALAAAQSKVAAEAARADAAEATARQMRAERDEWRRQAETAGAELARLRAALAPVTSLLSQAATPGPEKPPRCDMKDDTASTSNGGEVLYGVEAIALHLGIPEKACRHRVEKKEIPTFKIGGTRCARRSTLNAWLEKREQITTKEAANG